MSDQFSTPWLVFRKGENIPKGMITAHPGAAFIVYFFKIRGDYDPVINLIRRAPSMLALLEKAYPIIEEEADQRDEAHLDPREVGIGDYWTEMRSLANAIKAELGEIERLTSSNGKAKQ